MANMIGKGEALEKLLCVLSVTTRLLSPFIVPILRSESLVFQMFLKENITGNIVLIKG